MVDIVEFSLSSPPSEVLSIIKAGCFVIVYIVPDVIVRTCLLGLYRK